MSEGVVDKREVASLSEVPYGHDLVILSDAHAGVLQKIGIIPNELFFVRNEESSYFGFKIDDLLKDNLIISNPPAKTYGIETSTRNVLLRSVYAELGQRNILAELNSSLVRKVTKNEVENTLMDFEGRIKREYLNALSAKKLLEGLSKLDENNDVEFRNHENESKTILRRNIDGIIKDENGDIIELDKKLEKARKIVEEIREKL